MEPSLQEKPPHGLTPARRALNALLVLASAAVIFALYHVWGNTTELASYGRSAFVWMNTLWFSARIYGGAPYFIGWFIPAAALLLIGRDRAALRALPARPAWTGLAVVLLALALHWMGLRAQQTRLSVFALALLCWGVPFHLYGWAVARRIAFPCALLVLCVPLNFLDVFTFPLQRGAAALAGGLISGFGLPVGRQGTMLIASDPEVPQAAAATFDAGDAAGSLAMLLALILFSACWGAWHRRSPRIRLALLAATPLAHLLANALRLVGAALLEAATGVGGSSPGAGTQALVAALSILLLLALDYALRAWKTIPLWKLLEPTPPSIG